MEIKMSSKPEVKPQLLIRERFCRTKNLFHKAFRNLKSLFQRGCYHKLPRTSKNSFFLSSNRIQELDELCSTFSSQWESSSVEGVKKEESHLLPREKMKEDASCDCTRNAAVCRGEEKIPRRYIGSKRAAASDTLARKMKELEMMDVNDMDHVLDVEEALHYYSRLTCPAYQEIVDEFFVDMYAELHHVAEPPPARSFDSSMRKLGSASRHGSMRSLGPLRL